MQYKYLFHSPFKSAFKFHVVVLFLCLLPFFSSGQRNATTEKGEKIIVYDNKTWDYVSKNQKESPESGQNANKSNKSDSINKSQSNNSLNNTANGQGLNNQTGTPAFPIKMLILVIAGFLLIVGGILFYFLIFVPQKKLKVVKKAFEILNSKNKEKYKEAKEILKKALAQGLKKDITDDVNFALAYISAHFENYEEAYLELNNIENLNQPEYIYFSMWLGIRLKKYQDVFELYKLNKNIISGYKDSKNLAAIACLSLGTECWQKEELTKGIEYFRYITDDLKVFQERIPSTFSDQYIIQGIKRLLNNSDGAAESFTNAKAEAEKENKTVFYAELGLLVCEYKKSENRQIERELSKFLKSGTAAAFIKANSDKNNLNEFLIICNILLWHCVSKIISWNLLPEGKGLPKDEMAELINRLDKLISLNADMGDPKIIKGLVLFFFDNAGKKEEALKYLKEANSNLPEISNILGKEEKIKKLNEKSIDNYIILVKKYLEDDSVRLDLREQMREKLEKYKRFKEISENLTLKESEEEIIATIHDIQTRSKLMSQRIDTLIRPKLQEKNNEQAKEFDTLLGDIKQISTVITENSEKLQKTEQKVLLNAGEFLFNDEVANHKSDEKSIGQDYEPVL